MTQAELMAFHTAECNRIHELCDNALVPREVDGQRLSMAQRVEVLATVLDGWRMRGLKAIGGVQ